MRCGLALLSVVAACGGAPSSLDAAVGDDAAADAETPYGLAPDRPGRTCADIIAVLGTAADGAYWIDPEGGDAGDSFQVYCDMTHFGGGWTLIYKYIGTDDHSQLEILADDFAGPRATVASLNAEPVDAIARRAYQAFWASQGVDWMSTWIYYDPNNDEIDHNHAIFVLGDQVAWSDVYQFTPGCTQLPDLVTLQVFDDDSNTLVEVGSSTYRHVPVPDPYTGLGFLAADDTQSYGGSGCGQPAGNYLAWPAGLKFDTTLDIEWPVVIDHMWHARELTDRDKDRCSWFCWNGELTHSGREWYVR